MINTRGGQTNGKEAVLPEEALTLVRKEVDDALSKSPLIIREYTKHLTVSQGKFIRAGSVIICAEDRQGMVSKNAIKIAAAIEILHLATLVHDDVIDNADLRRGEITLQKKYGKRTAVICGDYLLGTALRMAEAIPNKKDYLELQLPDYISRLCLGELNQHSNNGNLDLSIYQYLKIISGKTAALFEGSFLAGAVFAGCNAKEIRMYKQIGYQIGMIFQLMDDCIDFEATVETANKPVQSDYEQGVITLPLIHTLETSVDFKEKARMEGVTREEINSAVTKAEGIGFTRLFAQKYYGKAIKLIQKLDATESKKANMISVLNKAAGKSV